MYPRKPHDQDLELARRVLDGDREAREEFCERMRCIGRILLSRNRRFGRPLSEHDLADLAQETALAVWRRLDTYVGRASLETWVYKFCALGMSNAVRRTRGVPRPESALGEGRLEELVEAITPEAVDEDQGEFETMLKHLSRREAAVLRLRHVDGMGNREIGQALDISINSVKTHSLNAMSKLRELFGTTTPREA